MTQSSKIDEIWQLAIKKYEEETETALKFDSQVPYNVDDWISEQEGTFKAFRKKGERIRRCLSPLLKLVDKFTETAGGATNVVSTTIPVQSGGFLTD
jgi:galactokinase